MTTQTGEIGNGGHLFMQTNEKQNVLIHYHQASNGTIAEVERVPTGGAGSGTYKPISGQESAPKTPFVTQKKGRKIVVG